MNIDGLIEKASRAQRESRYVEFKESFDPDNRGDWCEIVKTLVAMANSGGGVMVFGVRNNGLASEYDPAALLRYDPAKVTDKVAKYTTRQFADFEIREIRREEKPLAALVVVRSPIPMVFTEAGTYRSSRGEEKVAFQKGALYFRHGAKSEPAGPDDLRLVVEREVARLRRSWLSGMRKVVEAPAGSTIQVVASTSPDVGDGVVPVRFVSEQNAPRVRPVSGDENWPHVGKRVIELLTERSRGGVRLNQYDLLCVRRVFRLEEEHPEFMYRPFKRSNPQFSDTFVEWLVAECEKNPAFFQDARLRFREMQANATRASGS